MILENMKKKMSNIKMIIAEGITNGITKVSEGIARSVILGEKLGDAFKKIAQDAVIRILSGLIEMGLRIAANIVLEKISEAIANRRAKKEQDINDKFVFFWNNRNARRKQSGSLIYWYKDFLDQVGHDKAMLVMHTDPHDPAGQNLIQIVEELDLLDGQVQFSQNKVAPEFLANMYNMADCTINIADAEGFGLSSLESLS